MFRNDKSILAYLIVRSGSNVAQEAPNDDYLRLGPIAAREAAKFSEFEPEKASEWH